MAKTNKYPLPGPILPKLPFSSVDPEKHLLHCFMHHVSAFYKLVLQTYFTVNIFRISFVFSQWKYVFY